jgi:hypothetical protein
MSPAEFKQKFKVGDHIMGWGTGKVVKITGIGISRFLYADGTDKERVVSMTYQGRDWQRAPNIQVEEAEKIRGLPLDGKLP